MGGQEQQDGCPPSLAGDTTPGSPAHGLPPTAQGPWGHPAPWPHACQPCHPPSLKGPLHKETGPVPVITPCQLRLPIPGLSIPLSSSPSPAVELTPIHPSHRRAASQREGKGGKNEGMEGNKGSLESQPLTTVGPATPQRYQVLEKIISFSVQAQKKILSGATGPRVFFCSCARYISSISYSAEQITEKKKLPRTFWLSFKEICFHLDNPSSFPSHEYLSNPVHSLRGSQKENCEVNVSIICVFIQSATKATPCYLSDLAQLSNSSSIEYS